MKKTIYLTLALIVFTFAAAGTSLACSCIRSRESVEKQIATSYSNSVTVFSGTVTSIEETADGNYYLVKFAVKDTWKGAGGTEITVRTETQSSMCGYSFKLGTQYLVYAYATGKAFGVSNCSRTTSLPNKTDIKYLSKSIKKYATKSKEKL